MFCFHCRDQDIKNVLDAEALVYKQIEEVLKGLDHNDTLSFSTLILKDSSDPHPFSVLK